MLIEHVRMNTASHDSSTLMSTEADPEVLLPEALDQALRAAL